MLPNHLPQVIWFEPIECPYARHLNDSVLILLRFTANDRAEIERMHFIQLAQICYMRGICTPHHCQQMVPLKSTLASETITIF
jgi:hypothetical protein